MKKSNLLIIFVFILLNNLFFLNLHSKIENKIVVKVGNSLITSIDIQNEVVTKLVINNQEITQENIKSSQNYAIQNLINKSIKRNEINKYKITEYSKNDLQNYIESIAQNLNTDQKGLRERFKQVNINYQTFIDQYETELLWNTLIFSLYRSQTNINIVEVDNEIEKIKENKSEEEIKKIKENILNKKKQEKLSLFSRSHFSNLENSANINFQ